MPSGPRLLPSTTLNCKTGRETGRDTGRVAQPGHADFPLFDGMTASLPGCFKPPIRPNVERLHNFVTLDHTQSTRGTFRRPLEEPPRPLRPDLESHHQYCTLPKAVQRGYAKRPIRHSSANRCLANIHYSGPVSSGAAFASISGMSCSSPEWTSN